MGENMNFRTAEVVAISNEPIKNVGGELVDYALLQQEADIAKECQVEVDYYATPGTCGDERGRIGYMDDTTGHEPRPSVFGGPNVYGLGIAEMTGQVADTVVDGEEALGQVSRKLEAGNIQGGGHVGCAAAKLPVWMAIVISAPEAVSEYASSKLGEDYDPALMAEVLANTERALQSGRYGNWDGENALAKVLGDKAGKSIERLEGEHEGKVFIEQEEDGKTIDQTELIRRSVIGGGAFIVDSRYADKIDAIVTSGPDAVRLTRLALHARHAMHAAIANAVPNPVLYPATVR
jgi:hypothetical protein